MGAFTGTGALARLVVRRDRIKLPIWVAGITLLLAASASANVDLYPTAAERASYAVTSATSMVSRVLAGPMSGTSIGSIIMVETFLIVAVLTAFMSMLAVIRHTRQNEETGRAELIGSAVVGRHASMAAVLLVVAGANVIVGALCTLVLSLILEPASLADVVAYGAGITGTGLVFAGVAAVAAQITEGARAANGLAAAVVGVAFLLRGIGDALGDLAANGTVVVSEWLSWASPLGWGLLMHPFVDNHWWVLGLFGALTILLVWTAVLLADRRDVGAGMVSTRKGPAKAAHRLLSPVGLAWRLQRGVFIGWAVTMAIVGVGFGATGKEFESFFEDNEQLAEAFARIGADSVVDALFAALMAFTGIIAAAYIVQALLRMRSEETGPLEPVLATAVSRPRWMMSHIMIASAGAVTLIVLAGVLAALTYGLAIGDIPATFSGIVLGALVQIPAVLVIGGFVVLAFALLPRLAIAIGWGVFVFALLIEQLGLMLELPQWVLNISPFTHTPNVPAVDIAFLPLVVLLAAACALTGAGLAVFRRRNLVSS
jgi:ABC-2 type transport system permease protein